MTITKHFSAQEMGNPPADLMDNAKQVAEALEIIRGAVKEPLYVTSGYRDARRNRIVGGVSGSKHTKALAADFTAEGWTSHELAGAAQFALTLAKIEWDQIIWYAKSRHVHLGFGGARRQYFRGD